MESTAQAHSRAFPLSVIILPAISYPLLGVSHLCTRSKLITSSGLLRTLVSRSLTKHLYEACQARRFSKRGVTTTFAFSKAAATQPSFRKSAVAAMSNDTYRDRNRWGTGGFRIGPLHPNAIAHGRFRV